MEILKRYYEIQAALKASLKDAGREHDSVQLIAVSKNHPFEMIQSLYEIGHRDFGENYVQELLEKASLARSAGLLEIRWHFIGHLQTNKVKILLPVVFAIHSVDSVKVATEISKRSERPISILLEVNIDSENSKSGIQITEMRNVAEEIGALPNLKILGLMCIPDPAGEEGTRGAFRRLASLGASLEPFVGDQLSMGMTSDFHDAIAEGATIIRIGTAIFGERSPGEKL